jgi:hypothetical protein
VPCEFSSSLLNSSGLIRGLDRNANDSLLLPTSSMAKASFTKLAGDTMNNLLHTNKVLSSQMNKETFGKKYRTNDWMNE